MLKDAHKSVRGWDSPVRREEPAPQHDSAHGDDGFRHVSRMAGLGGAKGKLECTYGLELEGPSKPCWWLWEAVGMRKTQDRENSVRSVAVLVRESSEDLSCRGVSQARSYASHGIDETTSVPGCRGEGRRLLKTTPGSSAWVTGTCRDPRRATGFRAKCSLFVQLHHSPAYQVK